MLSIRNNTLRLLFGLMAGIALLTGCSSSDDEIDSPQVQVNANANPKTLPEYGRLEFPRLNTEGDNQVIVHKTSDGQVNLAIEWNNTRKAQRWTCYTLNSTNTKQANTRKGYWPEGDPFAEDPDIPQAYRTTLAQYSGSGYQRGHICPSADRLYSKEASQQTFYLSNIQPQLGGFNSGVWLIAENYITGYTPNGIVGWDRDAFRDTLYICKGGTIDKASDYTFTSKNLLVPKYFYMAILQVKNGNYHAIGLWFEHKANSDTNLLPYVVSIDVLEQKTGIDFFCNLPDKVEESVEQSVVPSFWGIK